MKVSLRVTPPTKKARIEMGTSVQQLQGTESAKTLNEFGGGVFPRALRQEPSPANTFSLALWDPEQKTQSSPPRLGPKECELINRCSFKPLGVG